MSTLKLSQKKDFQKITWLLWTTSILNMSIMKYLDKMQLNSLTVELRRKIIIDCLASLGALPLNKNEIISKEYIKVTQAIISRINDEKNIDDIILNYKGYMMLFRQLVLNCLLELEKKDIECPEWLYPPMFGTSAADSELDHTNTIIIDKEYHSKYLSIIHLCRYSEKAVSKLEQYYNYFYNDDFRSVIDDIKDEENGIVDLDSKENHGNKRRQKAILELLKSNPKGFSGNNLIKALNKFDDSLLNDIQGEDAIETNERELQAISADIGQLRKAGYEIKNRPYRLNNNK